MTYFVLAPSLRYFWVEFDNRFDPFEVDKKVRQNAVLMKNGDLYIYPLSKESCLGYIPRRFVRWGYPSQLKFEPGEEEALERFE